MIGLLIAIFYLAPMPQVVLHPASEMMCLKEESGDAWKPLMMDRDVPGCEVWWYYPKEAVGDPDPSKSYVLNNQAAMVYAIGARPR